MAIKTCAVCGVGFKSSPSDKTVTCSKDCSRVRKSLAHMDVRNKWADAARQRLARQGQTSNLAMGGAAAQKSPLAGPYETNRNAKTWVLRSPEGQVYRVRNLALWLRQHGDMLDGTPAQAKAGIIAVKQSLTGKRRDAVGAWKGWELLEWGD